MIFQATIQSTWKGENKSIVKHQERPIGEVFYLIKARLALWAAVKDIKVLDQWLLAGQEALLVGGAK